MRDTRKKGEIGAGEQYETEYNFEPGQGINTKSPFAGRETPDFSQRNAGKRA
jgi:hypothetical protein